MQTESQLREADGWYARLTKFFWSHFDEQQGVWVMGIRPSGDDIVLRIRATRATMYVRAHVQHDGPGGGGATYNPNLFVSSERVDCRANRQQDVTVTRATGNDYTVWLIPEFLEGDAGNATFTLYNGETGQGDDHMAFVALGANSQGVRDMNEELGNIRELLTRLVTQGNKISGLDLKPGEK